MVTSEILKNYGDRVSLAVFDFPLRPLTFEAAEAARCAGRQGKFWEYRALLFQTVRRWAQAPGNGGGRQAFDWIASDLKLDPQRFTACMDTRATRREVERDRARGEALRINSTPTFFIHKKRFVGYMSLADFEREILTALQEAGKAD